MNLFWLFFIVRIALNVVFADVVKDVRSDDEEEEEVVVGKGEGTGEGTREGINGGLGNEKIRGAVEAKKEI